VVVVGLLIHGCYIGGVYAAIDHGLPAGLSALIVGLQPLRRTICTFPVPESLGHTRWPMLVDADEQRQLADDERYRHR